MERFRGGNAKLTEALMLDHWLRELTFSGAFPIPMRVVETEWLAQRELKIARLFCWTHLPLIEMPLRAMLRLNFPPFVMVAQPGKIVGANKDEFLAPGLQERIPAIPVGADVLTKVRGILREGGSVACLADARMGGPLLPHVMRIAARMGARLVFQWAERQPNGDILVTFIDAPRPLCENAEAIRENLEYLRMANRRVLDLLGLPPGSPE